MGAARLVVRRSRTRGNLLLSLFAVVAIVAFLLAGMIGYLSGAADAAVRETLSVGPAKAVSTQLSTRLASDSDQQADATRQLIDDAFTDVEVAVHRTVRSNPAKASIGEEAPELILMADAELPEHATLVDGAWPSPREGAVPTAVQASAADALGIGVGDSFTVEGLEFVVEATWLPDDATDPYWFSDPAVASGLDRLSYGPVVTFEGALAELPVRSYARWTIVPTDAALTAAGLPTLASALDELALRVERADGEQNIELSGSLGERVDLVQRSLGVASALVTVPAVLVIVIGLITLAQLARLLVAVRRGETALLRARGASVTQLTVVSLAEAVAVIVPGGAVGLTAVVLLLGSGLVPVNGAAMTAAAWPIALAVVGSAALVCGVVGWRAAVVGAGPVHGDSGRTRASVTIGAAVLVLVAAGVSLWQFKLYGSPLTVGQDGVTRVDPLTVVAPALLLLALAMVGLLAFGPVARLLERWGTQGRGILPALPTRQVARRAPVFGVALLLVILAVSGTTLTAAYSQTWATASATAGQLSNGADVRVQLSPPPTVERSGFRVSAVPYLRMSGADDAATVLRTPVRIGDDTVGLTAVAAVRMPGVMLPVAGSFDPALVASALQAERTGFQLGAAGELPLTVQVSSPPGQEAGLVEVFAWLEDADGSLTLLSLGSTPVADAAPTTLTAVVPEGRAGEWTVLAVEAALSAADGARGIEVAVSGLDQRYALALSSTEPTDRAITYAELPTLPVVVTEALASRLSLEDGSTMRARIPSTASAVEAIVAGTTPAIPAADGGLGMIADLQTLNRYLLQRSERMPQPAEVWISATDGTRLVDGAISVSTTSATVTTPGDGSGDRVIAPALVGLWWGTAGALLLAAIAVLAITSTFARDRRDEVMVLRALGMSSSEQGRNRLMELVSVVGAALVTGVITGLISSALTVGELATTAAGASVPVSLRFDVLGWVALLFALVAVLVTISTGYAGSVSRQARDTEYRAGAA
ncbi:FtsX-like permease family protein [Homoserinimonas sp. A520]